MGDGKMVEPDISATHRTLEKLDRAGFSMSTALWSVDDTGTWTLHIHTGLVDLNGSADTYRKLQAALAGTAGLIPLRSIQLLPHKHPVSQALRGAIVVGKFGDARLRDSMINGVFLEDVILVRTPA
jgi:hypothetical protein